MIWMVLLGLSVVTRRREQMRLTIVATRFPLILQRISKLATDVAVLVFLIFLTYYGYEMTMRAKTQFVPSMNITMFLPYLCIPVGGLLTILQLCLQTAVDISRWRTSISPYIDEMT
jgi:C4-dicarboxylate transporter DctQ subunit